MLAPAPTRHHDQPTVRVAGRPVLLLTPAARRVRIGVFVAAVDRARDIGTRPGTALLALRDAAAAADVDPNAVEADAKRLAASVAHDHGSWVPAGELDASRVLGGVCFPLLGECYELGGSPLDAMPRWTEPVLAARTVADGAAAAFGSSATRPVRRALVQAIRPLDGGTIDFAALALALMGRAVLQPDRLARVLAAPRVRQPTESLPDARDLRIATAVLSDWGARRTERVLVEAAGVSHGIAKLLRTVHFAADLGIHGPAGSLPNGLDGLHDVYRALVPTAAPAPRQPAARARAPRRHQPEHAGEQPNQDQLPHQAQLMPLPAPVAPPTPPPAPVPHPLLAPPVAGTARRATPDAALRMPQRVHALHGTAVEDLTLVVPRSAGDLRRWGRLLSNCLGDFGTACAAGRSIIIGVSHDNVLRFAVEVTPNGLVRQFAGRHNQRPGDRTRRLVLGLLVAAGVVDPNRSGNQRWLRGATQRLA